MCSSDLIGGGVVGLSTAWGLLKRGLRVTVLDGDDGSFRASRGNFGLVWVQSKGLTQPRYAQWSQTSAAIWAEFAGELGDNTGQTVPLEQKGGYDFHFSEERGWASCRTSSAQGCRAIPA